MWTAPSLALLQNSMKKFNIHGEVGSPPKGNSAGYAISYQFAEKKKGIPVWAWLLNLLIIIVVAYFYYSKFM
ncbi:MAG: hypothetical protein Q4C68_07770 [Moraxella sp.]|nr:hypothetical protein [Moraxella sp.]